MIRKNEWSVVTRGYKISDASHSTNILQLTPYFTIGVFTLYFTAHTIFYYWCIYIIFYSSYYLLLLVYLHYILQLILYFTIGVFTLYFTAHTIFTTVVFACYYDTKDSSYKNSK